MKQSLTLNLTQQLTLTPQLKQSLRLLQLSSQDLEQEIQQALESNPLLDQEPKAETKITSPAEIITAQDNNIPQPIAEAGDPDLEIERTDNLSPEQDLSTSWEESFESRHTNSMPSTSNDFVSSRNDFAQSITHQETLFEHLNWQIQMTNLSDKDKIIADSILRSLDEEGYLSIELNEICDMLDPNLLTEVDEIHAVLSLIKTLEPVGAGARNLSERLSIFLSSLPTDTQGLTNALNIVENHLDLLATRNTTKLKKELNLNDQSLSTSLALITQLNPRIATKFKSDELDYVIPDVIVKKIANKWAANLNSDNQSKLRINQLYANMLKSDIDDEGSQYIQQNLQQAKMFIKGLMSRYDTLLLVSQAIVERQQSFFEHGEQHMQAMVLQDIATQLDMHESTISRATSGKYLLSANGVYELKYFFSSAVSTTDGASSSSTAIKSLIKKMIDDEQKSKPLSDSKIAKELEQQGHLVARRTVAKYRESMRISPSNQRKALV